MKQLVWNFLTTNYTFDASAKTVTITNRPDTLVLEDLLAIVNTTDQIIIYQPNKTIKGATLVWSVFTLEYDTTAMDDLDNLMILIDVDDKYTNTNEIPLTTPNSVYKSPSDFIATYTSSTTITLSALPFVIEDNSQLVYIKYIPIWWSAAWVIVSWQNWATITNLAWVLTVNWAGTPFASWDVYEVWINAQKKAYDKGLDLDKVSIEAQDPWSKRSDAESLVSVAQNLTSWFVDVGREIQTKWYKYARFWLTLDGNDSRDVQVKLLWKHTSWWTEEYSYDPNKWAIRASTISSDDDYRSLDWTVSASLDDLFLIEVELDNAMPYLQLQVKAWTVWATAWQIDALYITKWY